VLVLVLAALLSLMVTLMLLLLSLVEVFVVVSVREFEDRRSTRPYSSAPRSLSRSMSLRETSSARPPPISRSASRKDEARSSLDILLPRILPCHPRQTS